MPRFNVGAYMRKRKQIENNKVLSTAKIVQIQTEIVQREIALKKKRKQSHVMEEKL